MATYPQKTKQPVAITEHSKLDLSGAHVTTTNFMELGIANYFDVVPGQEFEFKHTCFTRLQPLLVPTFGDAYIHSRAFFVPYRTVFPHWNAFITDTKNDDGGVVSSVPYIKNSILRQLILMNSEAVDQAVDGNNSFDIVPVLNLSSNPGTYIPKGYNLTPFGARILKQLYSLGYAIDFNERNPETYHSALNLLAFFRVYMDWYYPSVYSTDWEASRIVALLTLRTGDYDNHFTALNLEYCFKEVDKVFYDNDYFTSAWDDPVAPVQRVLSSNALQAYGIKDPTTPENYETITVLSNGTPVANTTVAGGMTQFTDTALKSLTDYMKRHQIAGSRVVDRYLSRFGVVLDSAILDRSIYLGGNSDTLTFSSVTSTADTDGANLGDYAGQGLGRNTNKITFKSDEYGIVLFLTSIVPRTSYYQGANRSTMHLTKFDFWTPEFDNLGVQALAKRELFVPLDARQQYDHSWQWAGGIGNPPVVDYGSAVFGFNPRYAEYKVGHDMITGDFRLNSRNFSGGNNAWTLFRDVSHIFNRGVNATVHDQNFTSGSDSDQYKRIFHVDTPDADYFNVVHYFNVDSKFPGKPLYDTYEFTDEDKAQKVEVDVNGAKAN